jgi:hypothetical protein
MKYTKEDITNGFKFIPGAIKRTGYDTYEVSKVNGNSCTITNTKSGSESNNFSISTIVDEINSGRWIIDITENAYQIY